MVTESVFIETPVHHEPVFITSLCSFGALTNVPKPSLSKYPKVSEFPSNMARDGSVRSTIWEIP
ncbi:hypothetical protein CJ178_28335 [Rhodococcus sp. ACPA4]|nr:hypothetical protein CJ178_28335 [Rhodococcus sp. ACPA4]